MSKRVTLLLCALWLGLAGQARADGPGFQLKSTLPGLSLTTVVSAEGSVSTAQPVGAPGSGPSIRAAVRNKDHTTWVADLAARTVATSSLADLLALRRTEQAQVAAQRPPLDVAAPDNHVALKLLPDKAVLSGFALQAVALVGQGQSWRLWYATGLPSPTADSGAAVGSLVPADPASKGLATKLARLTLVRAEARLGAGWKTVFDTQSISRVTALSADLAPPAGFTATALRHKLPPRPPGGLSVPANVLDGPGPEMSHPELYAIFWGQALNAPASLNERQQLLNGLNDIIKPAYTQSLDQYNVHGMKLNGVYSRPDLPPVAVGWANFAAISAMVYDVGFRDGAPIFWWEVGGHDPLYVLMVDESEVDTGHWDGYHFVAFSLTHAVLPFPVSLFAHDAIPWAIAKVPHGATTLPGEAALSRAQCRTNGSPATTCDPLFFVDAGTKRLAHEAVEAATDPYVFLGWSDPFHQPFYSESEVSDICNSNSMPWAAQTVVGISMVATYWSNLDQACVPESRPTLKLFMPTPGQIYPAVGGQVVFQGFATDPVDGDLTGALQWSVDGVAAKDSQGVPLHGSTVGTTVTPGPHTVMVSVIDSAKLQQTLSAPFSAQPHPAQITIVSPLNGATAPNNSPIVLRGAAFHFQPGDIPDNELNWFDGVKPVGNGSLLASALIGVGDHTLNLKVVNPGGIVEGPASVTVHVVATTKVGYRVMITAPADGAQAPVSFDSKMTAPVTLTATLIGDVPNPTPDIYWTSDLQGPLGKGASITVPLAGGSCAPWTHRITATAVAVKAPIHLKPSGWISFTAGQAC